MRAMPLILLTVAIGATQSALAHTELAGTTPANGAMIAAAPDDVKLEFSEPVRLTALSIQMDGARKQSLGPLPSETTANFAVALPALEDGHYVVSWRALSEDTHVVSGEFMFAVDATGSHEAHMNHGTGPAGEHAEPLGQDHHDDHGGAH